MKTFVTYNILLAAFCVLMIFQYGCKNRFESAALGKFKPFTHKLAGDSTAYCDNSDVGLLLAPDMSFTLRNGRTVYSGKWKAYDDGDHTWIVFSMKNGNISQDYISGVHSEYVEIINPVDFGLQNVSVLVFKRYER
ncbi:hypothetical protein [Dinghuibacter silviterrae]|uniref:Lipocalin-like protein n=1 Tax=Dinghuibacter silviterrae TaxID=1539049 RepID=A0A4R8DHZ8_9BACT|nr:hypothetical protein [Dinghuibacter silviterrae]TDW97165.1 hypothetical protein EDB95_5007 [Dinghuibacter silviterrae]